MDHDDSIAQIFPGVEDVDLYAVLDLTSDATPESIKKAYRRLALLYHPDKHVSSSENTRAEASKKFQQVGFAYSVLNDPTKRARYDKTGSTSDSFGVEPGENGWEAYFADLFDRVTKAALDKDKKEYQGSAEEAADLNRAYLETDGSIDQIMEQIPHSTHDDEERFIKLINTFIKDGSLPASKSWQKSIKDENTRASRRNRSEKEAKEAEALAKELGMWDDFYGNGKKSGGGSKANGATEDEDLSALQAIILRKKAKTNNFFDDLAAKYAEPKATRQKKRSSQEAEVEGGPEATKKKKSKASLEPPEIDDEEFAKLQQKLFGDKGQKPTKESKTRAGKKARR